MKVYDPISLGFPSFKLSGLEAKICCPFHNDHTPSAHFNIKTGLFHCFGCGTSANIFQLAKMLGGSIVRIDGSEVQGDDDNDEWHQLLYSPIAYDNPYLMERGVSNEQVEKFGIRSHDDGVMFPVLDRHGVTIGMQMRRYSGEPKYILYGQRTPVWPLSNLKYETLSLVEGVFGVLRGDIFGFKAVCTMGASAVPLAAAALEGHRVKVMFDDDVAGYMGAYSFMKLHFNSSAVTPGVEADELSMAGWAYNVGLLGTRDIVAYAIEHNMNDLIGLIKSKEKRNEQKAKGKVRTEGAVLRKIGLHRTGR